jgi:hypothetical protein
MELYIDFHRIARTLMKWCLSPFSSERKCAMLQNNRVGFVILEYN